MLKSFLNTKFLTILYDILTKKPAPEIKSEAGSFYCEIVSVMV